MSILGRLVLSSAAFKHFPACKSTDAVRGADLERRLASNMRHGRSCKALESILSLLLLATYTTQCPEQSLLLYLPREPLLHVWLANWMIARVAHCDTTRELGCAERLVCPPNLCQTPKDETQQATTNNGAASMRRPKWNLKVPCEIPRFEHRLDYWKLGMMGITSQVLLPPRHVGVERNPIFIAPNVPAIARCSSGSTP